ncbi:MAG: hypothetical protein K2Q20_06395 [Phycisphaerales bacterium]|nr:hypothetical protein [Phycisphaerales bacterium]
MDAAERARIDREKHAVLSGRTMPLYPKPLFHPIDWKVEALTAAASILVAGLVWAASRTLGFAAMTGVYAGALVAMVVLMIVSEPLRRRRVKQRSQAVMDILGPHRGLVCPTCHYALSSLASAGHCPECGTLYTHRQVVELWTSMYNVKIDWLDAPNSPDESRATRP